MVHNFLLRARARARAAHGAFRSGLLAKEGGWCVSVKYDKTMFLPSFLLFLPLSHHEHVVYRCSLIVHYIKEVNIDLFFQL